MARRRRYSGGASLFGVTGSAPDVWRVFNSAPEFVAALRSVDVSGWRGSGDDWAGGTFEDAARFAVGGDLGAVDDASKYADMINDAVELAGVRSEWSADMVGAFPSVPAFLAGDPCAMWARSPVQDERGEISVYVNICASQCVKPEELRRRGVCVLAAVLALSRVRSVRLVAYASTRLVPVAVRLPYPLDISAACAFLSRPVVMRKLFLHLPIRAALDVGAGSVGWAKWAEAATGDALNERDEVRRALGDGGPALVLTPHKLGSWAGLSRDDFVERLNAMIAAVNDGGDIDI